MKGILGGANRPFLQLVVAILRISAGSDEIIEPLSVCTHATLDGVPLDR